MMFCESQPYQNSNDPDVHYVFRGRQHVHLMGDNEQELIEFATSIGMKATWLQRDQWKFAHFDCTGKFMKAVQLSNKVEKLDRRSFVDRWKELRRLPYLEKLNVQIKSIDRE